MHDTIYAFSNYRKYLHTILGTSTQRTGFKGVAAKAMGCSSAYLSRVLQGVANLSLEQGQKLSVLLQHSFEETQYLLLLINFERAGTAALKEHCRKEIELILRKKSEITLALPSQKSMPLSVASIYYSQWYYAAIHVLLSIPTLQSATKIARCLGLQLQLVVLVIQFLERNHLVQRNGANYTVNMQLTHLTSESPFLAAHHQHWRNKVCAHLGTGSLGTHYSGVVAMSIADAANLKRSIAKQLQDNLRFISASTEEAGYAYCVDFFSLNDKEQS